MCNVVVIIKRFRELSLACLCTAVLLHAQPALRDRLRENLGWALKEYVPGRKWDRGRPRWNVLRKPWRPKHGSHARLCRGKQTKRNASEPGRGEAWRHRRRRFSL